jgi:hypothetical protein
LGRGDDDVSAVPGRVALVGRSFAGEVDHAHALHQHFAQEPRVLIDEGLGGRQEEDATVRVHLQVVQQDPKGYNSLSEAGGKDEEVGGPEDAFGQGPLVGALLDGARTK